MYETRQHFIGDSVGYPSGGGCGKMVGGGDRHSTSVSGKTMVNSILVGGCGSNTGRGGIII